MPSYWSAKDERQYKAIKKSCLKRGKKPPKVCTRMAAATVNKQRRAEGRTLTGIPDFLIGAGAGTLISSGYVGTPTVSYTHVTDCEVNRITEDRMVRGFLTAGGLLAAGILMKTLT